MSITVFLFYFFIVVAGVSALAVLLNKNIFNAALYLLVCLLSVAALYVFAMAEFVAITQILVYAGGILVLIIFVIMLTSKLSGKVLRVNHRSMFPGILMGIALIFILSNGLAEFSAALTFRQRFAMGNPENMGIHLITKFALPFEVTGILLLITLVGSATLASFIKSKNT